MNTILQKRIEEVAENHEQCYNVGEEHGYLYTHKGDIKEAVIYGATFALQNQWISVEEELPKKDKDGSDTSIYVLVTDSTNPFGYIWKAYYDFTIKDWYDAMSCENLAKQNITHWMEIPSLKGGEK